VDPRAGLDDMEIGKFLTLQGLEIRHLGRPVHTDGAIQAPESRVIFPQFLIAATVPMLKKMYASHN
jgi:hypothetical protein